MKTYEIEIRGQLTKNQYTSTRKLLKQHGKLVQKRKRLFIDYTTMLPGDSFANRTKDIRARITNGEPELIIKLGTWGKNEGRREISVKLQRGHFSNLVSALAQLGLSKGVLCERNSEAYRYKDAEIALVEVPQHSCYFEIEKLVHVEAEKERVQKELYAIAEELQLQPFTDQEFFDYMERLNAEVNTVFDIEKDGEDFFRKKYNI